MTRRSLIATAAGLSLLCPLADAHRIDEYLQATLLTLDAGHIHAAVRLVPGEQVAASVIKSIDTNADGKFSEREQRDYAQLVTRAMAISIDGRKVRPTLVSWRFPPPAQMREGLGEVHIDFTLNVGTVGTQRLVLSQTGLDKDSVYLMNVVAPRDPAIVILSQKRNRPQSRYELTWVVRSDKA